MTHALMKSQLTDAEGAALGTALDRIESIERIAGQYAGRGGDQQFRLYVKLKPGTREVLEKSQRVLPRSREHGLPRRVSALVTARPARSRTSSSRCPRTDYAPTSTSTTDRARRRRRCSMAT